MYYTTGEKIQLGDTIYLTQEKIVGIIDDIIFTQEKKNFWGVDEFGLMIQCYEFGLLFLSINFIRDIEFLLHSSD